MTEEEMEKAVNQWEEIKSARTEAAAAAAAAAAAVPSQAAALDSDLSSV
jgi:hypothetical protein